METNSETTSLLANLMVSYFVQCNIFVNSFSIGHTKTNSANKKVKYNRHIQY